MKILKEIPRRAGQQVPSLRRRGGGLPTGGQGVGLPLPGTQFPFILGGGGQPLVGSGSGKKSGLNARFSFSPKKGQGGDENETV